MYYHTLDEMFNKKDEYNFIVDGKCTGKTTAMTGFLIKQFKENGRMFVRLFRSKIDLMWSRDLWFHDYGDSDHITFDGKNYYLNGELFGETAVISLVEKYNYNDFNDKIYYAVFDDYNCTNIPCYLENEVNKFKDILKIIFKNREKQVFLIGNNDSYILENDPYYLYLR